MRLYAEAAPGTDIAYFKVVIDSLLDQAYAKALRCTKHSLTASLMPIWKYMIG
jgi:hypothetical protein